MATPKRRDDVLRALCAQVNEDDGLNPRLDRKDVARGSTTRKDLQLCKQVMTALSLAMQSEAADPALRETDIAYVDPDPDASRLRVGVRARPGSRLKTGELIERLRAARGFLRSCIGDAISRKRVPELVFSPAPTETDDAR